MTLVYAVTKVLGDWGLFPYPGKYIDLDETTPIKPKDFSKFYIEIASLVEPNWRSMDLQSKEFRSFWQAIDNEVESRGYYIKGESHNTPLKFSPSDSTSASYIDYTSKYENLLQVVQKFISEVTDLTKGDKE